MKGLQVAPEGYRAAAKAAFLSDPTLDFVAVHWPGFVEHMRATGKDTLGNVFDLVSDVECGADVDYKGPDVLDFRNFNQPPKHVFHGTPEYIKATGYLLRDKLRYDFTPIPLAALRDGLSEAHPPPAQLETYENWFFAHERTPTPSITIPGQKRKHG